MPQMPDSKVDQTDDPNPDLPAAPAGAQEPVLGPGRLLFLPARWLGRTGLRSLRWLGWGLLSLLTLGLAYPWMRASLERYKLANTFYGDLRGSFVASGGAFFARGVPFST